MCNFRYKTFCIVFVLFCFANSKVSCFDCTLTNPHKNVKNVFQYKVGVIYTTNNDKYWGKKLQLY